MNLNFEQMTDEYLHHLQSRSSERHARAKQVLLSFQEDTKVETLDESNGHLVFHWITSQNWSPNTMRNALSVFNGLIGYASRGTFSLRGRLPRPEYKQPSLITAEQHTALVAAASPELANVLKVLWATGARQGEIASAQVDQVRSTDEGFLLVQKRSRLPHRPRMIYVPPKTADLIRTLAAANGDGPIFRNSRGGAWTTESLRIAYLRLCRKVKFSGGPLRCYRNSALHRLRRRGVDSNTIERLLGYAPRSSELHNVSALDSRLWQTAKMLEEEK